MQTLNGKKFAADIKAALKEEIKTLEPRPGLAVILIGDDPASHTYVGIKEKACQEVGINFVKHTFPSNVPQQEVVGLIERLNKDKLTHGILIQLPLPETINTSLVISAVDPKKDADGFHPKNIEALNRSKATIMSPVYAGVMHLLRETQTDLSSLGAVILANSEEFAHPLQRLLNQNGIKSASLIRPISFSLLTQKADILIVALGQAHIISAKDIKKDAIIIDIGFNHLDGKPAGDVDTESVSSKAAFISPVPGGLGPLTVAYLLKNVVTLAKH
jgi:methylenetetrahydrofolate dehydrogenase (NADP+)/methenyltetrahydrofolate cyclohydrolase